MNKVVNIKHLSKGFGKNKFILKNIDFSLEKGSMTALIGASGEGKTTLLNLIGSLDNCYSGQIIVSEQDLSLCNEKKLSQLRNTKVGFVLQEPILIQRLTVEQNILLPTVYLPSKLKNKTKIKDRMHKLAQYLDIEPLLSRKPNTLSGGQKQRVVAVRALINDPEIVLADEPTGSLDEENAKIIIELFKKIKDEGKTILTVTHDKEIAALHDSTFRLSNGEITKVN
ncbi:MULTISPECIES: ABC transporter ATP-binding protein [Bacteria]|uniref:ABC transporter ATP-binding protein n=1 Tax=Bacteria TaxID=2 RepID=UPI0018DDD1CD|nr:ABC transporter ATP-binding protein [Lactobacillus sp. W8172]MBI0021795.1 ABC transporter ATP-binding protein [Lactobacillus sp. W8172]